MSTQDTTLDLADYEDATSAEVRIKHPETGAPTSMVITIAGPEHPARRRIAFDRQRKVRAQIQRTGKMQLQDPEDDLADDTELLVACTLGWSGLVMAGQPVAHSAKAARDLYEDPKRRWLRAQVRAALDERELFIKRSASN